MVTDQLLQETTSVAITKSLQRLGMKWLEDVDVEPGEDTIGIVLG